MATKKKATMTYTRRDMTVKQLAKVFAARVDKGIAFLDRKLGRKVWIEKINLKALNLNDSKVCMCGQLFEEYWRAEAKFFRGSSNEAAKYGFNRHKEDEYDSRFMDVLTYTWYCKIFSLMQE